MGLMKVFSGSEVLAIALQERLEEAGVETVKKDKTEFFEKDTALKSAGNTIFFDFQSLEKALGELDELQPLRKFAGFQGLCFQIQGNTASQIKELFEAFGSSEGLQRFQLAFQLLALVDQVGPDMVRLNE